MTKEVALKYDSEKPAYHLIDLEFLREVVRGQKPLLESGMTAHRCLQEWALFGEVGSLDSAFWYVATLYGARDPAQVATTELARSLAFGAKKYSANNWRRGFEWHRLYRAAWGHIESHMSGQMYDPDSGLMHLSHALAMIMFLWCHQSQCLGTDDRAEMIR